MSTSPTNAQDILDAAVANVTTIEANDSRVQELEERSTAREYRSEVDGW